jgi:hypothetical protein
MKTLPFLNSTSPSPYSIPPISASHSYPSPPSSSTTSLESSSFIANNSPS